MYTFMQQLLVYRYGIYVAARGMNFPIKTGGETSCVVDGKQHKNSIDKECEAPAFFLQKKHHPTDYSISDGNNVREKQVGQSTLLARWAEIDRQQEHHVGDEENDENGTEPLGHFHVDSKDFIRCSEHPLEDGNEVSPLRTKESPQAGEDVIVGEECHPDDGEVDAESSQNIKI